MISGRRRRRLSVSSECCDTSQMDQQLMKLTQIYENLKSCNSKSLQNEESIHYNFKIQCLKKLLMLKGKGDKFLQIIAQMFTKKNFEKGDIVSVPGNILDGAYFVESGIFSTCKNSTEILSTLLPGDCFSELALQYISRQTEYLTCVEDGCLLEMKRNDVRDTVVSSNRKGRIVNEIVARQLENIIFCSCSILRMI